MNIDLDKFIEAITITDKKYGSGNTRWINYLYQGDIHCFTSTNGARDLIASYDYKMVQQMVITKIFENLKERTIGKITLLTSHRLTNVHLADWIMVLEYGHIIEQGTRQELLQKEDSRFSELYQYQAKKYTTD